MYFRVAEVVLQKEMLCTPLKLPTSSWDIIWSTGIINIYLIKELYSEIREFPIDKAFSNFEEHNHHNYF